MRQSSFSLQEYYFDNMILVTFLSSYRISRSNNISFIRYETIFTSFSIGSAEYLRFYIYHPGSHLSRHYRCNPPTFEESLRIEDAMKENGGKKKTAGKGSGRGFS